MRAFIHAALVLSLALGAGLASSPVQAAGYKAPRTADGHPDLQGQWTNASLTHLERPGDLKALVISEAEASAYEARQTGAPKIPGDDVGQDTTEVWEQGGKLARLGGEVRTSWLVEPRDGRLPYSEAGRRLLQASLGGLYINFDGPEARPAMERCLLGSNSSSGPPMLNSGYNNNYQFVQTKDALVVVVEMNHDARIIPLAPAAQPAPAQIRPWMGRSVGRWDGDTLVVETDNFNVIGSWRGSSPLYISPAARVTERFTRVSADEIRYEFAVDDPAVFTQVWRGELPLRRASGAMYEVACHEGNYSMTGILAGGRQKDREAAAGAVR
jgi:hypothetical protein